MPLNTIEHEWEGFAAMVFRGMTPTPTQRTEMKKAFFAGAWAMFTSFELIGTPAVSEADAHAYLEDCRQEILAFKNRILAEYAEKN